jgi:hypothetical protein
MPATPNDTRPLSRTEREESKEQIRTRAWQPIEALIRERDALSKLASNYRIYEASRLRESEAESKEGERKS